MSWKKYGGINQLEQLNNLNANNLVIDNLSVRNAYQGNFTICGELIISNTASFQNDVDIIGNTTIHSNASVRKSLHVGLNTDISNNLSIYGNTFQYDALYLVGKNGQGMIPSIKKGTMYFLGDTSGVGMNKINPQSTLDICGSTIATLNVFSNQSSNRNILARNNKNYGITLTTDLSSSSIDFFHSDKTIQTGKGGASVSYDPCGNLTIDTTNDTILLSNIAISNRKDGLYAHIKKETVVIYDNSSSIYLPEVYTNNFNYITNTVDSTTYKTGTALSLVASDTNATTFLNISNRNKAWQWGAGSFPKDLSRNMATTGWTDNQSNYIPIETIVSGNSLVNTRATIGVNTYSPETEKYAMDINGPIHIHHNEIHLVENIPFEIISMSFSRDNRYGVAIGSSTDIGIRGSSNNKYYYSVLYTQNGGEKWQISELDASESSPLHSINTNFNVFFLDVSNVIIAGSSLYFYKSTNGGITWSAISLTFTNFSIPSIYIAPTNYRLFLSCPTDNIPGNKDGIYYFDISNNQYLNQLRRIDSSFNISCSHGYQNTLFVAGNGISTYNTDTLNQINTIVSLNVTYNAIYTLDGIFTIAVGDNIISYTRNGGNTWVNNTTFTINARDVFIQDLSNAIVVGDNSTILYTRNGGIQWNRLLLNDINAMGNGNRLLNPRYRVNNVKMTDINTLLFSIVTQNYIQGQQYGKTELYHTFLPNIFNTVDSKSVLDICGNMKISGDIHINDSGSLKTNNSTFHLIHKNANTVYFAGDASTIFIGNSNNNSVTYLRHQLDISGNLILQQNAYISGIEKINNTTNTTDLSSGALQVLGGVSIQKDVFLGGNAIIYQDLSLNGNQKMNGNLIVQNNVTLGLDNSVNTITLNSKTNCVGNVFMNKNLSVLGDVSVNNNFFIGNDVSINNNLFVKNNTYLDNTLTVNKDSFLNNNLFVTKDCSFNGKLFITGDVSFNGNVSIDKDVFLNSNLYISNNEKINGKLWVVGDVSFSNNQEISGNLIVHTNQTVNGNAFLNGNITLGNGNNDILTVNAASYFVTDVSMLGNVNISGNTNIKQNVSVVGNISTSGDLNITGNIRANGPLNTIGTNETDLLSINSQTTIKNKLSVHSDISSNGNIIVNNTIGTLYTNNIESFWYYQSQDASNSNYIMNIGNNTTTINVGKYAKNISIGNPLCNLQLYGNYSAPIVQPDIRIYLNTTTTSRNASLAGVYIKEGGVIPGTDVSFVIDAGFMITSNDRNRFKFKVPNSNNVVSLDVQNLTLPPDMNNGVLVINRNPISPTNLQDNDISYNIGVSVYDISNIVVRDRILSTSNNQVIHSNISLLGNMSINRPSNYSSNSALDISGNFLQNNGWITQF
jgi:UDP-3-O-[3-hydroxymyristoyl] glucosamine N-acyltransferase